jgi:Flp pilus assembly protein TadD
MSTRVADYLEAEEFSAAAGAFRDDPSAADAELLFDALEQLDRDDDIAQLQDSLQLAEALISSRPQRDDAHLIAIECLRKLGRADDALALARRHRDRGVVRSQLYQLLCLHGHLEEAAALVATLADLDDDEGNALYNLGARLHGSGAFDRAVALYRGAVAVGAPMPQANINLGIALLSMGRASEAADSATTGLQGFPGEPNLLANLLDASVRTGDSARLRSTLPLASNALGRSARCQQCEHRSQPATCGNGCGALLEDMSNAWMFLGDGRAAVTAIESACGDGMPDLRVRYALARALCLVGHLQDASALVCGKPGRGAAASTLTAPGCVALLSTPPSVAEASSFYAYRARAAVAAATGDLPGAAAALCAALFVQPSSRDQLAGDASWAALGGREPVSGQPLRPPTLLDSAWWDASEKEWVIGDKNRQTGDYKYFRPDGSCCNRSSLLDGKPHGPFVRFHENGEISQEGSFEHGELHGTRRWIGCDEATTEHTRQEGMSPLIWRSEMDYSHGRVMAVRHFDRAGALCAPDGTRYPERPDGVPAAAAYYPEKKQWRHGEVDGEGKKNGTWKTWSESGQLIKDENYRDDELHGLYRAFHLDGSAAAIGEYVDGDQLGLFTYLRGAVARVAFSGAAEQADQLDLSDDDDDSSFPSAGARVAKIEQLDGRRRYFDRDGRETLLDGRPLAEVQRDPVLASWLADLELVDWSALESAGGRNPPGYNLLVALIAEDEAGSDRLSHSAWGSLYWHFCHQGTVYSGTAAAVPFLIRLLERKQQPNRLAIFDFLRSVGGVMRGTYQRAQFEGADEGWADLLAVIAAYCAGYPVYRHALDEGDAKVRAHAARLLGSCHADAESAVRALAYRLIIERDPGVRGNLLQSLGNLGAAGADNVLRRSLGRGGLEQICAAIGMVMCKADSAGLETVSALVGSLAHAHLVEATFDAMPWSELSIHAELANALAQTGRGSEVLDDILVKLDQVDPLSSISVARSALIIAHGLRGQGDEDDEDDEDDEEDHGDGGAALRKVARALARASAPWKINVNLHEVLHEFDLPTERSELGDYGKEPEPSRTDSELDSEPEDDLVEELNGQSSSTRVIDGLAGSESSQLDSTDDEIERSLGVLDEGALESASARESSATQIAVVPAGPRDATLEAMIVDNPSAGTEAELDALLDQDLLEEEPSGTITAERQSSRSFPRAGSDAWLSDVHSNGDLSPGEIDDGGEDDLDANTGRAGVTSADLHLLSGEDHSAIDAEVDELLENLDDSFEASMDAEFEGHELGDGTTDLPATHGDADDDEIAGSDDGWKN